MPGRSAWSWAGALAVLLAWGAVGPGQALAGCSHYGQTRPVDGSAGLPSFDLARTPVETPPAIPARPAPCKGAMCSGKPAPPPASSGAPAPIRIGSWAILALPYSTPAARSSPLPRDARDARAIHPPGSVFHPPRVALPHRSS